MIVRNVPLISFIAAPRVLGSKEATTIVTRGDTKGDWVLQPEERTLGSISENGLLAADSEKNSLTGFIDIQGKWIIPSQFRQVKQFGAFGLAPARHISDSEFKNQGFSGGKWGYINTRGEWVIQPIFDSVESFASNGLAIASLDNKYGYIKTSGEWAIPPAYNYADKFSKNGLARVEVNRKTGFINGAGEWVIPPSLVYAYPFAANGLARTQTKDGWGFIDEKGDWVIPAIFQEAGENFGPNGLVSVVHEGKDRVINIKGEFMPAFDLYVANRTATSMQERERKVAMSPGKPAWDQGAFLFVGALIFLWILLWPFILVGIVMAVVVGLFKTVIAKKPKR